jgi:hypothetical protein
MLELASFGFMEMEQYLAMRMPAHRWSRSSKDFISYDGWRAYLDLLLQRLEQVEIVNFLRISSSILLDAFARAF